MVEKTQILWTTAGKNLPSLGSRSLVDVSDGDTPNIRMPIRMLSIDTPEVTAKSTDGAVTVDNDFNQLAEWIRDGIAPVSNDFRDYILPKLENTDVGTLQFAQGKNASAFYKQKIDERLTRPTSGKRRNLFIRSPESPFDNYGRLLAYVAPSYSKKERRDTSRRERATFNLNMIESGWAAPFILFPNIPGELDLPLFLELAVSAKEERKGQYQDNLSLPGYEYRMCEKLYNITKKVVSGASLSYPEQLRWRTRYCADMRDRKLFGPENYFSIPEPYRIWLWADDVQRAISMLNLVPA
jgi:endonuclease YncB( thermonuclease family)